MKKIKRKMIYLMRHGLDDERFVGGWSSVGLTEEGIKQIKDGIEFLKKANLGIVKIVSSDIKRAYDTAIMISEALNLPVEKTPLLRELNKGKLNGALKTQNNQEYLDNVEIDTIYPEGESQVSFIERVQKDLDELLNKENALLVTHRGIINEIYRLYNGDELSIDKERYKVSHGSIHELDKELQTIKKVY